MSELSNNQLILKIEARDLDGVKKLIEQDNADVHFREDLPIVYATELGELDMVKYLTTKGADVNAQFGAPITAGVDGGHLDIVKYLIENGADLKINGYHDLYLAAERGHLDILKFLLEEEKSIESFDLYIEILQGVFIEAVRYSHDDIITYMVEQHVDIHANADDAMYLAIGNFDQITVNYLISQGELQDVPYTTEDLIRIRNIVADGMSNQKARELKRLFSWNETNTEEEAEIPPPRFTRTRAIQNLQEYLDDEEGSQPASPIEPPRGGLTRSRWVRNLNALDDENQVDSPGSMYELNEFATPEFASDIESPTGSMYEFNAEESIPSSSDYEEDQQLDPGYEYKSDDESVDDPVELKEGENEKDKIKSICTNDISMITLEEYENLDDMYTVYRKNREGEFFEKGECGTKSELRDYLNSDIGQEIPSFFMTIGTTPKLQQDLLTGFTSKPTGKIVVRLPNDMYVTLKSIKRILAEKGHSKWFALPLYNGKNRRIVNLRGFYGIGNNHGQVPGFVVYKLFTGSEIKNKVRVQEGTDDFPSVYLHDMMEPLFDILDKYNIPVQQFIDNVIKNVTATKES